MPSSRIVDARTSADDIRSYRHFCQDFQNLANRCLSATQYIGMVPSEDLVATPPTWSRAGSPSTMTTSVRMRLGRPISTP